MEENISKIIENFKGKKVLVIGDVMLDRSVQGSVSRVSPEAPVPIIHVKKESFNAGGAGNVACNLAQLGAIVNLVGVVGEDETRDFLIEELENEGVKSFLIKESNRPTIQKLRLIGKNQQILRIDSESTQDIKEITERNLLKVSEKILKQSDVIVISDYDKGTITRNIAERLIKLARKNNKPIIVDTKPDNISYYKNSFLITLNKSDVEKITGIKIKGDNEIKTIGKILVNDFNSNIIITMGGEGIAVFGRKSEPKRIPGKEVEIVDISGAGDTVTSALALAISTGASLEDAAVIANHAASIVITKRGVSTVTSEEIKGLLRTEISEYLRKSMKVKQTVLNTQLGKIEELTRIIIDAYKNKNKILVFGNGGSAADSQHLAGELVGRFKMERQGLPAIALTTDTSIITALANDYGYDSIFERQIEALGNKGDVAIGITTSGNSPNILKAIEKAKELGITTVGLTGEGGKLKEIADLCINVPSTNAPWIQETHITIIHILCTFIERELFENMEAEKR